MRKRKPAPFYSDDYVTIYCGDAREIVPAVLTYSDEQGVYIDTPYNCAKAEWDNEFPEWVFDLSASIAPMFGISSGNNNIGRIPHSIGDPANGMIYRWMLSAHLTNGMTRGAFSFNNWIPCALYARDSVLRFENRQDCKDFAVGTRAKNKHPSPKPLNVMKWFLSFFPAPIIVDYMMGSGTTLLAARALGKRAIGVDREREYCEEAVEILRQPFIDFGSQDEPPAPEQGALIERR